MTTSRRRTSKSSVGQNLSELESRIKKLERRITTFRDSYSITSDLIAPGAVTLDKLDPQVANLIDNISYNNDAVGSSVEYQQSRNDDGTGPGPDEIQEQFNLLNRNLPCEVGFAISDEYTNMTVGTDKTIFRMPFTMRLTEVRASLAVASTSGDAVFVVKENGSSIFSTNNLQIDAGETTSLTSAQQVAFSDVVLADNAKISVDITSAGTGAKGPKIWLIGVRL